MTDPNWSEPTAVPTDEQVDDATRHMTPEARELLDAISEELVPHGITSITFVDPDGSNSVRYPLALRDEDVKRDHDYAPSDVVHPMQTDPDCRVCGGRKH